jgi:NitT/TauT family transport system permease protein
VSGGSRMSSLSSIEPKRTADGAGAGDLDTTRAAAPPRRADVWGGVRRALPPVAIGVAGLVAWELLVRLKQIPYYILPGPLLVIGTLVKDWSTLYPSLLVTLAITGAALLVATVAGVLIAILFTQSRWIELSLFPYAVILQVTPVVAIAPLIIIWVKNIPLALLICAWIVAFFPIVSNTTLGLNSADHNLLNLFQLYGASRRQVFWHLKLPSAMPYFLGGLRISGGLALIGAVVAEFVAGTGGVQSGLAYRVLEAGYTMQIPRMFAALLMITGTGILIFLALTLLSHLVLRSWHESAVKREG